MRSLDGISRSKNASFDSRTLEELYERASDRRRPAATL
jgi:hypothetical protein